jgi:hypothetical protein
MNGEIQQATWLELARQQSRKAAETRAAFVPPVAWERMDRSPSSRRGPAPGGFRVALSRVALWILLPALVAGGAGGTWAFVRHLREARRPEVAIPSVVPVGEKAPPSRPAATTKRQVVVPAPPAPAPAPVSEAEQTPRRKPPRKRVIRTRPRTGRRTKKPHHVARLQGLAPKARTRGTERITFGTSDAPGEGVIIVPPPAKLKPLWTPKAYKENGRRDATW